MIRVGILSFSDGRKRVHDSLLPYIKECETVIKDTLEQTGEVEVITGSEVIYHVELANSEAKAIAGNDLDAIILNVPVFAFPNFSTMAVHLQNVPCLAIAPVNGKLPGLGGLFAAVNLIRQTGGYCEKVWGNISEPQILRKVMTFLRASHAVSRLRGQVYGLIGGRSIGMGSGAVNPDLWMNLFGVDVEHIDQLEIIRQAEHISPEKVMFAFDWIRRTFGGVHFDGEKLTEESLKMQIRCYYATQAIVAERKLNFLGVKCHYELSEYYVTQCLAAALFNDPYDWDGPKPPMVYSCEADSDGALTMQVMNLISGKPVLFIDFRHYDRDTDLFAFCNCGAMATWYAQRSDDLHTNLQAVNLYPIIPKYGGKGCHVQFIAAEGEMTFARLTRTMDRYKLTAFSGSFRKVPPQKLDETCPVWPHGFVQVKGDAYHILEQYNNNHVHAVSGNILEELESFCKLKNIEYENLDQ